MMKVFNNLNMEPQECKDMEAELKKMVRAEIQLRRSGMTAHIPKATFFTARPPVSNRVGFPAIEMDYCGR